MCTSPSLGREQKMSCCLLWCRGVHFFRPVPKEYLHSAELRDIMQFGSSSSAVFFKMRVAGVLHVFQFDTRQVHNPNDTRLHEWRQLLGCSAPAPLQNPSRCTWPACCTSSRPTPARCLPGGGKVGTGCVAPRAR